MIQFFFHAPPSADAEYQLPQIVVYPTETNVGRDAVCITICGRGGFVVAAGTYQDCVRAAIESYRVFSRGIRPASRLLRRLAEKVT